MVSLLLTFLIIIIIFGAIFAILQYTPLQPPLRQIAYIIMAVLFVVILIAYLLPMANVRLP